MYSYKYLLVYNDENNTVVDGHTRKMLTTLLIKVQWLIHWINLNTLWNSWYNDKGLPHHLWILLINSGYSIGKWKLIYIYRKVIILLARFIIQFTRIGDIAQVHWSCGVIWLLKMGRKPISPPRTTMTYHPNMKTTQSNEIFVRFGYYVRKKLTLERV